MRKIRMVAILMLLITASGSAREFGNAFGDNSRKASVEALEGLAAVFNGLRSLEISQTDQGKSELLKAADLLAEASRMMQEVTIPAALDKKLDYDKIDRRDAFVIQLMSSQLGRPLPTDLKELYLMFSQDTFRLNSIIVQQVNSRDPTAIYPRISDDIANYLHLAGLITRFFAS